MHFRCVSSFSDSCQGGLAGDPTGTPSASTGADVSNPAAASGILWIEDAQTQQISAEAKLNQQRVASNERLAARSADLMSRVDEQVQLDTPLLNALLCQSKCLDSRRACSQVVSDP